MAIKLNYVIIKYFNSSITVIIQGFFQMFWITPLFFSSTCLFDFATQVVRYVHERKKMIRMIRGHSLNTALDKGT